MEYWRCVLFSVHLLGLKTQQTRSQMSLIQKFSSGGMPPDPPKRAGFRTLTFRTLRSTIYVALPVPEQLPYFGYATGTHRSAESRSTPLITSLRLASRGSLYSPFSSPCCVYSHCSAFLFWYSLLGKSSFNQLHEQRGNIVSRTNRAEFIYGIRPN